MRQLRKKSLLVLLSLLLVLTSAPLAAAADSSGSTVVWSLDTDRLGIPGLTENKEYLEGEGGAYQPGVQLADQANSFMQMYAGGLLGIHSTKDEYKAINIQTGDAVGGTSYYANQGFKAEADTEYTITFNAHVADGTGQVRVRGNTLTAAESDWQTTSIGETPVPVSYTWTQSAAGGNLQIDTGSTPTNTIVYISDLQITTNKVPVSKEVWALDANRLGVPGLTDSGEYLMSEDGGYQPGVQLADQSSSSMQMYAGGWLGIQSTKDGYKAINIQTGDAVGGTSYYANQGFNAQADTEYTVTFSVYVAEGTGQVRVRGNTLTAEESDWQTTSIGETPTQVSYTWTQLAAGGNLQIDTGNTPQGIIVYISDLRITQVSSTPPPPISGEVVVAYNLQWDVELPNFVSYGGSRYLQKAGPNINAIGNSDGSVYLDLPNRTESWHGVDIRSATLGIRAGSEYTIDVTGRVPDDIEIPVGAKIVLGGSGEPWTALKSVDADRSFALSYSGTAAANTGETTGLRIQADVALTRFLIDSIIVKVKGGNEMPQGTPDIGVPDDYEWPDPEWNLNLPSLKDAYRNYFHIGNIIEPGQSTDPQLTAMFKKQYNVVTAENAMKPDAMMGSMSSASDLADPSKYTFEAADQIVQWAEDNNLFIHGHTLVWHSQTPSFINTDASGTREAARANMKTFIDHIIKHFDSPNLISWDVVNEAFDDDTSKFNGSDWRTGLRTNSPWYIAYENGADKDKGESGADYIYDAFVFAHLAQAEIGSTAKLYYNDYNETYKYEQIAQMAETLNAQWEQDPRYDGRKLIEGVGMQSHFWIGQAPEVDEDEVVKVIERFIEAGVRISVSELDIPFANNKGYHLNEARQAQQAELYGTLFNIYKKYAEHIDRVTFWGNADSMSWRGAGMPLLFDNSYRPKTAFYTVLNLGDRRPSGSSSTGGGGAPAVPGEVKVEVTANDLEKALADAESGVLKLQVEGSGDAEQIHVSIPVNQVQTAKEAGVNRIEISSGLATVQLPVSLFADAVDDASIELNIEKVDNSTLSEEQQSLVGSNTVFDFNLSVGGQEISDFGQGQSVKIAIPYTLNPGENPSQIVVYYLSDDGNLEVIKNSRYNKETGMVTFNAKHFSKYTAMANPVSFDDVAAVQWASESIEGLAARDIVSGKTKDTFAPGLSVTRAEFVQMLVQTLDLNQANATSTFSDAKRGAWYYEAVASAEQLGIVAGLPDGSFGMNNKITRQEMAAMAYRAIQKAGITLTREQDAAAFRDAQDIAGYAKDAVTAMHEAGIINGTGNGNFNPQRTATRAEAAVILYQLLMKSL